MRKIIYDSGTMDARITKNRFACCLLFVALLWGWHSLSWAISYNTLPEGLPPGLPTKPKGNYRIIEHSTDNSDWRVYDVRSFSIGPDPSGDESVWMQPPIYKYVYNINAWDSYTVKKPKTNTYVLQLVTIIDGNATTLAAPPKTAAMTEDRVIAKLKKAMTNSRISWNLEPRFFRTKTGNEGHIVCGSSALAKNFIPVWFATGGSIYSVNGTARGNTPGLELTFDVSAEEGLAVCR